MARKVFTVALNGVTGRMGHRRHLVRSLLATRQQGGLPLGDGTLLYPEPVLVGRRILSVRLEFGYAGLIKGDDRGHSDALLGAFAAVTATAAAAPARAARAGGRPSRERTGPPGRA